MKPFDAINNPRDLRRKLRLNQSEFWSRVGVTQSGGSRYETGRRIPRPVRELLRLVHVEGIVLSKAKGADFAVGAYLRKTNPQAYGRARKAAATGRRSNSD
jgi:transcriptional regulator with XRE-family HTH domain